MATSRDKYAINKLNNTLERNDTFQLSNGSTIITDDADCTEDIHTRLGNGLSCGTDEEEQKSSNVAVDIKVRLLKASL